ncbi:hypothetical protein OsJ_11188 [Oryza sativa Japonica Group]|uniref:Peptidase C1A papain C-terminal domain-containing protein n=1 Tax=Oryza sativa subsp. japonica TaxID=39947 RepID=B9F8X4_ORYSJ|nr:hypothetical protein OsJ_11188 [Oryza sativa Japonica Group]
MLGPTVMRTEGRHHVGQLLLRPHPRCPPMGFTVMRGLHQNPFWCSAHVGHHQRPLVSCEGAGVGVVGSGVPSGSSAAAVASSFTSSEAKGRRWGATAPAASSTTHWSPKDPLKLMHELTETTGTDVARKGRTGIERNSPIYYGPGNTTISHSILIVGYDVDDLGDLYWVVKNSWGKQWGDQVLLEFGDQGVPNVKINK